MKGVVLLVLCIVFLSSVKSLHNVVQGSADQFHETWQAVGQVYERMAWPHRQSFIQLVNQVLDQTDISISSDCRSSLHNLTHGLTSGETDAIRIFDSFSKIKSGTFRRKHVDLGNYDQCVLTGDSRYTLLQVTWPVPQYQLLNQVMTDPRNSSLWTSELKKQLPLLYWGPSIVAACFPSSCRHSDIQNIVNSQLINRKVHPFKLKILSTESISDTDLFTEYSVLRLVSRTILICVIATTLISSSLSPTSSLFSSLPFLRHFDSRVNSVKVWQETSDPRMDIFNGFKVVYLLASMISHYGLPSSRQVYPFLMETQQFLSSSVLFDRYTRIGFCLVSCNFVIGAALASYSWVTEMRRSSRGVSFSSFFLIRFLRTLPLVVMCHLFGFSMPLFGPGLNPYMQVTQRGIRDRCLTNWWRDYVFMANAITVNENCNPATWYLSTDMQLYLLSFFTMTLLAIRPRIGLILIGVKVVIGIVLQLLAIVTSDVSPVVVSFATSDSTRLFHVFTSIYYQWYNQLSSYAVGLLLGYLIAIEYTIDKRLTKWLRLGSTIAFFGTNVLAIVMYDGDDFVLSRGYELAFGSVYKALVSAGFAGLMFLGWSDSGSWVRSVLSCRWMIPLSRLSFSIFLVHMYIVAFIWGMTSDAFHFSYFEMILRLLFLYPVSIVVGYAAYICVEAPFYGLMKSLLSPTPNSSLDSGTCDKKAE